MGPVDAGHHAADVDQHVGVPERDPEGAAAPAARRLRATFVMEQHLGHRTFYENLRRHVEEDPTVRASWVPVGYGPAATWWDSAPLGDRLRGSLRGRHEARRGPDGNDVEVTFFNTQVPAVLAGRRARGTCFVVCTDITPLQYDRMADGYGHVPDRPGPVATVKHAVNRRLFQAAARAIGWSTWARRSLVDDYGVAPERTAVIPPGVDTHLWRPAAHPTDGPMRILFVGGDLERKGGRTLLEAFRRLPPGAAELAVVTRTAVAEGPGLTVHHGLVPNAPELIDLYRSSDVFVLASEAEAFGIAAVEAAASGLPVIATRTGGIPDIVVHDETGFLVDPRDAGQLAHRLEQLVRDRGLARRLGAAGRRRAVACFDAATNATRVLDLLREAASD